MKLIALCLLALTFFGANVLADPFSAKLPEKVYTAKWCKANNGESAVRLADGTWPDCLTGIYAVEVDFAPKWYQAVGQALHYAMQTGKRPGVVLIVKSEADMKLWHRLNSLTNYYNKHYNLGMKSWKIVK